MNQQLVSIDDGIEMLENIEAPGDDKVAHFWAGFAAGVALVLIVIAT